ncbi:MAG: hypothetical protein K2Y39_04280 [Candidatus Obscuribacterales bacterium]|nr:hypothetical protein [Candidatus Obscuribacterales bacterium]
MEIFSHNYATAYGRSYAGTSEDYFQESLEPQNRLTNRELQQIRAIREEIESRPKITRFEARYIRTLKAAEQEFCGIRPDCMEEIKCLRELLKGLSGISEDANRSITIALLCAAIAKQIDKRR